MCMHKCLAAGYFELKHKVAEAEKRWKEKEQSLQVRLEDVSSGERHRRVVFIMRDKMTCLRRPNKSIQFPKLTFSSRPATLLPSPRVFFEGLLSSQARIQQLTAASRQPADRRLPEVRLSSPQMNAGSKKPEIWCQFQ